ncbi:helix-turn-helix domain-containing protein [Saccharopolyspora sp. CA-218241]|uniref:helix-turn-helix domain-containing protein n=1 Tax=Saccharopolyspora sp. CA-218241 TaxID=3240027 RepID=UPI003D9636D9
MPSDNKESPKVRALGAELREHRKAAGISVRKLAEQLQKHHSVLARYETGEKRPESETVAAIMTALGASDIERTRIVNLARDAEDANWVAVGDSSHRDMTTLIEYERTACRIVEVATTVVPGILQTYDYARSIISKWSPADADARTAIRVGRRDTLTKRNAPEFVAIITENALREPIGGSAVHAEQLHHLLSLAKLPNVEVIAIPCGTGEWNPSHAGSFLHFEFAKASPIVYIEHFSSLTLLHTPKETRAFGHAIDSLRNIAMSPEATTELITRIAEAEGESDDDRKPAELAHF